MNMASATTQDEMPPPTAHHRTLSRSKRSKRVTLTLSPRLLARFADPDASSSRAEEGREQTDSVKKESVSTPQANDSASSTPVPNGDDTPKRKGVPGPRPGTKRSTANDTDGIPKPKGKPGPKKKKVDGENGSAAPAAAPAKLGPKANTGAINAHLRALDRSGKPCRRWDKKSIALKTFTGVVWDLGYWQSPKSRHRPLDGETQSETTGSSDAKIEPASSMVGSDRSNGDKDVNASFNGLPDIAASSPVSQQPMDMATPT